MKKQILILTALSLTLFSCFNGKKTTSENDEKNENDSVLVATDTISTENDKQQNMVDSAAYFYAISNQLGTKFLVKNYGDSACLGTISYAIFGSKLYQVKFAGKQMGNEEKNTYRDTWQNFDNLEGFVFENVDNALIANPKSEYDGVWSPILLCNKAFMQKHSVVPFKYAGTEPEQSLKEAFEAKYERKIKDAKISFVFGKDSENKFCSMQFENVENQALGVYAICTADGIFYLDFPQTITEDNEYSVWRVDDGGDFYLENTPVVILRTVDGYVFKMEDVGFEGYNCYTITLRDGKVEKFESEYSAYTAPM